MATDTTSATRRPKRARLRRLALAGVTPALALALIASTAPAASAADVGVVVDTKNGGNARVRDIPSTEGRVLRVLPDGTRLPDAVCRERTSDTSVWVRLAVGFIRADTTGFDTRVPECDDLPPTSLQSIEQFGGDPRVPCFLYRHGHLSAPALVLESYDEGKWSHALEFRFPIDVSDKEVLKRAGQATGFVKRNLLRGIDAFQYQTIHKVIRAEKCGPDGLMLSMRTEVTETYFRFGKAIPLIGEVGVEHDFIPIPGLKPRLGYSDVEHPWEYLTPELSKVIASHDGGCANPTCVRI